MTYREKIQKAAEAYFESDAALEECYENIWRDVQARNVQGFQDKIDSIKEEEVQKHMIQKLFDVSEDHKKVLLFLNKCLNACNTFKYSDIIIECSGLDSRFYEYKYLLKEHDHYLALSFKGLIEAGNFEQLKNLSKNLYKINKHMLSCIAQGFANLDEPNIKLVLTLNKSVIPLGFHSYNYFKVYIKSLVESKRFRLIGEFIDLESREFDNLPDGVNRQFIIENMVLCLGGDEKAILEFSSYNTNEMLQCAAKIDALTNRFRSLTFEDARVWASLDDDYRRELLSSDDQSSDEESKEDDDSDIISKICGITGQNPSEVEQLRLKIKAAHTQEADKLLDVFEKEHDSLFNFNSGLTGDWEDIFIHAIYSRPSYSIFERNQTFRALRRLNVLDDNNQLIAYQGNVIIKDAYEEANNGEKIKRLLEINCFNDAREGYSSGLLRGNNSIFSRIRQLFVGPEEIESIEEHHNKL